MTNCVPLCVPVFRNIPACASVGKFSVTPLLLLLPTNEQFKIKCTVQQMNLTENAVIRWVFIRLLVKSNSTFLFNFFSLLLAFLILFLPFGLRNAESTFQQMMTGFHQCGVVFCRLPALKGLSHEMDLAFEDIHHGRMNYTDSEPLMSLFL